MKIWQAQRISSNLLVTNFVSRSCYLVKTKSTIEEMVSIPRGRENLRELDKSKEVQILLVLVWNTKKLAP